MSVGRTLQFFIFLTTVVLLALILGSSITFDEAYIFSAGMIAGSLLTFLSILIGYWPNRRKPAIRKDEEDLIP